MTDLVKKTAEHTLASAGILRAFMRRGPDDPEIWTRAQVTCRRIAPDFVIVDEAGG